MEDAVLLGRFGAAVAIGLLIGLQREYAKQEEGDALFAGTRTFALVGLAGALSAYTALAIESPLVFAGALLLFGGFIAVAYFAGAKAGDIGLTTEVAALVTFLTGALCAWGDLAAAAAVGVATTLLLALKPATEKFVDALDREDVVATLKFAVLAALVLPLLPREPIGPSPFDAASPFKVGLMVVFISGLSFLGYVLIQTVGAKRGIGLTGILGGLVSSTAVTLTFAQRSRDTPALAPVLALGILLAWTIMFVRVLIEVGVVNAELLPEVWLPIAAGGAVALAWAGLLYFRDRSGGEAETAQFSNPFSLGPAIQFGLLYGGVLIASKAASIYFGDAGVYLSALLSGLADVDAITLSMSELSLGDGAIEDSTAANAIAIAAASNTAVKGGLVLSMGSPSLRKAIGPGVVLIVGVTVALAFLL